MMTRWQRLRARVLLALTAAVLAAGLCELAARAILPPPPNEARQPQITYRYDPDVGYVMTPQQQGWIDDGFVTINSMGFRGPEVTVPKPAGRFRIAVIGDSLTLGWGVGDDENFSAQLEMLLRRQFGDRDLDVVNMGVAGYDTRQEVALLEHHVRQLQPDLVLVGFYSNDVPDGLHDVDSHEKSGTVVAANHPQAGQELHMNLTAISPLNRVLRKSRLIYNAGRIYTWLAGKGEWGTSHFSMEMDLLNGKDSPQLDRAWQATSSEFQRLHDLAMRNGFTVAVVVLPCKEQVMGRYGNARYQSRVREIVQPLGFTVIDPLQSLAGSHVPADRLFIPYDRNHPSAAGHRIIAEELFRRLEEHVDLTRIVARRGDFSLARRGDL